MRYLILLSFILIHHTLFAQIPSMPPGARGNAAQMNMGRFYGKIVDTKTGKPIDAASVQLLQNKFDSATKTRKEVVISGQLTRANGDFSLENLSIMGQYKLKVTAIGFKTYEQNLSFGLSMNGGNRGDMSQMLNNIDKDLGNIKLEEEVKQLSEVVVEGTRPTLQLGVDRKIFNVDRNIVSQGGTAVDVMRNVPTVDVDVEGNISLRNNAPQIFVDGRPSVLSLDQIPADAIQTIELITNPSAKFDASGGQSAIINIVLKKNKRVGYSGNVRTGIDMRGRPNIGGDINLRQGKINAFANLNYSMRKNKGWGETDRNNLIPAGDPSTLFLRNDNVSTGDFAFARGGIDYYIDNRNTITLSGNLLRGNFRSDDINDIVFNRLNTAFTDSTELRVTDGQNLFRGQGVQLSFKHNYSKPGKEWTADINYNQSNSENDQDISISTSKFSGNGAPVQRNFNQGVDAGGANKLLVAQTDFVNPLNENMKIEFGLRSQTRWFESFQQNSINGIVNPRISNQFEFVDYVHAGYVSFAQKVSKANLNYQVGLRAESSSYDGKQIGKDARFQNQFPLALFPSAFVSKTFKNKQDLQLNYSRRVNRPSFFQLLPNTDFTDVLNFQTGNPDLKPEFTHSLEMSYQKTYGKKNNLFLVTIFGKQTNNLIARYQSPRKIGDSDTLGFVTTFVNATSSFAAGLELVFRNTITKWWEINYNANFYHSKINGTATLPNLQNERSSFFIKINNTFRLNKGWTVQLSGDYRSRSILPVSSGGGGGGRGGGGGGWMMGGFGGGQVSTTQGYIDANYYADLGIRKEFKIKNNTASVGVNWSDFLRTRQNIIFAEGEGFNQYSWRRRDPQFVRVNFSYRFGKFDASIFKRRNNRMEGEGMEMMQ